jgi:hypothetical protein
VSLYCCLPYPKCIAPAPNYIVICGLCDYTIIFHTISQTARVTKKNVLNVIFCFYLFRIALLFALQILSEILIILRRIQRDIITSLYCTRSLCTVPVIPFILIFSTEFQKNHQIPNFIKTLGVRAEWSHADRRSDLQTEMTKPIVAFRNFSKAPKNRFLTR